jgi:hypothetical protein
MSGAREAMRPADARPAAASAAGAIVAAVSLCAGALAVVPTAPQHADAGARPPGTVGTPDDAALLQCASEQGWRGLVDALERESPPRTDDAKAAFERARLRIDATDPRRPSPERAAAWQALDEAHVRRIAVAPDAPARQQAIIDRATDALRIGLFADPSAATACASAAPDATARALALLRAVEDATQPPSSGGDASPSTGRIAFLHAASQSLQMGIDRTDRGGAASRDRRARAELVLARLRASREGIDAPLSALADLAECAAASAAGDPDSARAAAVRIVYLGEPLPAMMARIFVCDALAESRMGDRALTELVQVIRVDGLSLPLRILAADAYVRLRDSLGKSSLAAPTFESYGEVIRRSAAHERWSARLAVVERLGPITARAVDTSWLPAEGLIARAHAQRVLGTLAAGDALRTEFADPSPDRSALAAIAALDAGVRTRDDSLAADALRALATRFADDAAWSRCSEDLALLEIAHDATDPRSRSKPLRESIVLALAIADAPTSLPLVRAAQQAIDALELAQARTMEPAEATARLVRLTADADGLSASALAGTRVLAAMLVLDACAIEPSAAIAPVRPAVPEGLSELHPRDALLLGACLAERARDAGGSPAAAAAAARLKAMGAASPASAHAARGAREAVAAWVAKSPAADAKTARGLAAVLDAAASIDPPGLDAMRLDVQLARRWGSLSPTAAADRSERARITADHPHATREDLLALSDALIDEAAVAQREDRDARLADAMSVARLAESLDARDRGARVVDWDARERMIRAARIAGRAEQADAHIARLAAIDATLGGNPTRFASP